MNKKKTNKICQRRTLIEICHNYEYNIIAILYDYTKVLTVEIIKYLYHTASACVYDFASDTIYKFYIYDTIFLFHAFIFPTKCTRISHCQAKKKTKLKQDAKKM